MNRSAVKNTWCVTRWTHQCTDYCAKKECREMCGTGGGHRDLKEEDFKLKGDAAYEYRWNHGKLGSTPRDFIIGTTKFADGAK